MVSKYSEKYIFPVIIHFYIKQRNKIVPELKTHIVLNIIGDGRCDSRGFSAKYETQSFMEPQSNKIIDFTLMLAVLQILL